MRSGRIAITSPTPMIVPPSFSQRSPASAGKGVHRIETAVHTSSATPPRPAAVDRPRARRRSMDGRGSSVAATTSRPPPMGSRVKTARRDTTALSGTAKASTKRPRRISSRAASAAGSSMGRARDWGMDACLRARASVGPADSS